MPDEALLMGGMNLNFDILRMFDDTFSFGMTRMVYRKSCNFSQSWFCQKKCSAGSFKLAEY